MSRSSARCSARLRRERIPGDLVGRRCRTIVHRASDSDPTETSSTPSATRCTCLTSTRRGWFRGGERSLRAPSPPVQVEYAPFGQATGLCAAVATTAYQNEGLSLQPCSTPGTTVFIIDLADAPAATPYFPIVNASTTDFTHPFTDRPSTVTRPTSRSRADHPPAHARQPGARARQPAVGNCTRPRELGSPRSHPQ